MDCCRGSAASRIKSQDLTDRRPSIGPFRDRTALQEKTVYWTRGWKSFADSAFASRLRTHFGMHKKIMKLVKFLKRTQTLHWPYSSPFDIANQRRGTSRQFHHVLTQQHCGNTGLPTFKKMMREWIFHVTGKPCSTKSPSSTPFYLNVWAGT